MKSIKVRAGLILVMGVVLGALAAPFGLVAILPVVIACAVGGGYIGFAVTARAAAMMDSLNDNIDGSADDMAKIHTRQKRDWKLQQKEDFRTRGSLGSLFALILYFTKQMWRTSKIIVISAGFLVVFTFLLGSADSASAAGAQTALSVILGSAVAVIALELTTRRNDNE
jgi:hypothetical protein